MKNLRARYKTLTPEEHATSIYNALIDILPYSIGFLLAKEYYLASLLLFLFQEGLVYVFSVIWILILHDIYKGE